MYPRVKIKSISVKCLVKHSVTFCLHHEIKKDTEKLKEMFFHSYFEVLVQKWL